MVLDAHEAREALAFGEGVGALELPGEGVGEADVARLAGGHHLREALHHVVEGRVVVPHVADVEVDVVHAEVGEARVQALGDVALAADAGRDLCGRARQELGGDHDVVASGEAGERASQVLLGRAALVGDGRVEEVDAGVERAGDDRAGVGLTEGPRVLARRRVAEPHAAQADARDRQVASAEARVPHG